MHYTLPFTRSDRISTAGFVSPGPIHIFRVWLSLKQTGRLHTRVKWYFKKVQNLECPVTPTLPSSVGRMLRPSIPSGGVAPAISAAVGRKSPARRVWCGQQEEATACAATASVTGTCSRKERQEAAYRMPIEMMNCCPPGCGQASAPLRESGYHPHTNCA